MRGRVLGYDQATGYGAITGEDGQRYQFVPADWKHPAAPISGQLVDFVGDDGQASAIYTLAQPSPLSGDRNRIVAALLAFFLGGLGVHKFYLGKNTAGIIMLLCTLFGIILLFLPTIVMGFIAFVEFIIYLVTSDEDFHQRYVVGDKQWF